MDNEDTIIAKLTEANRRLKLDLEQLSSQGKISRTELQENQIKVEYLTGFPNYSLLEHVYQEVEPCLDDKLCGSAEKLSKFDVFLISLMKLKLDLPLSYLSIQYRVEFEIISKLFRETIIILKKVLARFVFWPKIKTSLENNPAKVQYVFGTNRRIFIIQCFEVYCERPGDFVPQPDGQRYNTIKFMIAFSAAGHIVYISKSFGGWSTDSFIVGNCDFLSLISTDDVILFSTSNHINKAEIVPCCISLDNSSELVAITVTRSKEFANLLVDVELIISKLRQNISILTKKQRIVNSRDTNLFLEYIMLILCAITNLSQSWMLVM